MKTQLGVTTIEIPPLTQVDEAARLAIAKAKKTASIVRFTFNGKRLFATPSSTIATVIDRYYNGPSSYDYESEKEELFSDAGQRRFLRIRDNAQALLKKAGAFRMLEGIAADCGSSWALMACVDRMVELGEIREITGADTAGQDRVFVSNLR